jgi:hypothetical protein
MHIVS